MSLPAELIEALFARLAVRYGDAFLRQYAGFDLKVVRADWAGVLDGFSNDAIAYALRYLPSERPPNAMQFRDICRRAPPVDRPRLPDARAVVDPRQVAQLVAAIPRPAEQGAGNEARVCIDRLRAIESRVGTLTLPQRAQLEACERRLGIGSQR
jgi:hypothetical protein